MKMRMGLGKYKLSQLVFRDIHGGGGGVHLASPFHVFHLPFLYT
jgi:hypothetical protein